METTPLLRADRLRVDDGGAPVVDGLSLATRGRRVVILGAPRALFEAAAGLRPVAHGVLEVVGKAPPGAIDARACAVVPCDPPLPPRWTVKEYVTWSARLAGMAERSDASAAAALARARIGVAATQRLDRAPPHVRRAAVIAAAIATAAPSYLLDDPLSGLTDDETRALGPALLEALGDADFVAFLPRALLASPLVAAADEAIVLQGTTVAAQGSPGDLAARARAFVLRVAGDPARFAEAARARGVTVETDGPRLRATLPDGFAARDLLALGLEHGAVVVELRSAAGPFA